MDPDEREPLIDLTSAPTSPAAETPPPYSEATIHNSKPRLDAPSTTAETLGRDDAPGQQPDNTTATASTPSPDPPRRLTLAPWYFARVCAVYIGPVQYVPGKINNRWLIVSEVIFYVITAIQIPLTAVLTVLGAINKDKEHGVKSELGACPELAVVNVLWLLRPAYIGYFLLWAYLLRRKVIRLRKFQQARSPNLDAALADGTQAEHTDATTAGRRLSDEELKKLLPSPLNILIHLRLVALSPLVTWVLNVITLSTWWARVEHCRSTSPHVFLLASIILIAVNVSFMVYFGFMFSSALQDLIRGIRSRLPSVAPLSQSAVDRIPLVVYRAADCGAPPSDADLSQHVVVPTQWGPAAVISPSRTRPKHSRQVDVFRTVRNPNASSRLPDAEDGTEATPLLNLESSSDIEDDMEATPLLNLAGRPPAVTHDATYPYVTLSEDEAKCTICLCDFTDSSGLGAVAAQGVRSGVEVGHVSEEDIGHHAVDEVMSTPPLLRQLSCGHVYHKECIDPWLTQKSGRCPYCQKAVEVPGKVRWSFWKFLKCECQCQRSR
ncbi:hypothetical protein C8Q73DRAFT_676054 [Cubamyces lactineus]|nr:hypothetical protein C8Q73DRAFT_676054 [Cubamyces lactineus]